jgi:hypothetical protein
MLVDLVGGLEQLKSGVFRSDGAGGQQPETGAVAMGCGPHELSRGFYRHIIDSAPVQNRAKRRRADDKGHHSTYPHAFQACAPGIKASSSSSRPDSTRPTTLPHSAQRNTSASSPTRNDAITPGGAHARMAATGMDAAPNRRRAEPAQHSSGSWTAVVRQQCQESARDFLERTRAGVKAAQHRR